MYVKLKDFDLEHMTDTFDQFDRFVPKNEVITRPNIPEWYDAYARLLLRRKLFTDK